MGSFCDFFYTLFLENSTKKKNINKNFIVLLVYFSLVLDNILLTVVGELMYKNTIPKCHLKYSSLKVS